jgi:hypothetical protein
VASAPLVEEGVRGLKTIEAWALGIMEFVQGVSLEEWGLLLSLLLSAGALYYAKRAARVSEEELVLAREQAELRPKLEVTNVQLLGLREAGVPEDYAQPPSAPPPDKVLRFKFSNRGTVAATGVRGRFFFPAAHLQPVKVSLPTERFPYTIRDELRAGHFVVRLGYSRTLFPDEETLSSDIAVSVRGAGRTSIRYELVSAEGGSPSEGELSLEVPQA